jgi:hypothetical protein
MRALPDHRGGGLRGLAARLGGIAPAVVASIVRSRLFIKYVGLFVAVVSLALVANGAFDVYFSYQEQKASLVRIQREQAEAAAGKIGQFITEIESQVGWTTQLPWSASTLEQRRFDALRLLRQGRRSPNSPRSTPAATSSCACRGSPWKWSAAATTCPKTRPSPRRWRTRSITARSISAANPSPT